MRLLCVFSCLWSKKCPEIVLKFRKKLVLKFYFVLLGPLQSSPRGTPQNLGGVGVRSHFSAEKTAVSLKWGKVTIDDQ